MDLERRSLVCCRGRTWTRNGRNASFGGADGDGDDDDGEPKISLKEELLEIKKKLSVANNENYLLKVKVRKLENELCKKDKNLLTVLNPQAAINFRKFVSDQGASLVLSLREENQKLQRELETKDVTIKKLQHEMKMIKSYNRVERKKPLPEARSAPIHQELESKLRDLRVTIPYYAAAPSETTSNACRSELRSYSSNQMLHYNRKQLRSRSLSPPSNSKNMLEDNTTACKEDTLADEYEKLIHNLQKIKSTVGAETGYYVDNFHVFPNTKSGCKAGGNKYVARSDSSIHQHLYETPHEEIQQLHQHFEDMLNEVVELKKVITELKSKKNDHEGHGHSRKAHDEEVKRTKSKTSVKKNKIPVKPCKSESDKERFVSKNTNQYSRQPAEQKPKTIPRHLEHKKRKEEESERLFYPAMKYDSTNTTSVSEIEIIEEVTDMEDFDDESQKYYYMYDSESKVITT